MSNTMQERLTAEMKACMKAKNKERLIVVRSLIAAIKQVEIDSGAAVDEAAALAIVDKAMKQRRDSHQQFMDAERPDLAEQEAFEMTACMKAKNKERLIVVRSLIAAIKQVEIDSGSTVDEAAALAIVDKAMKQRRDSHQQFVDADRPDLAEQEAFEMMVIQDFMPEALTDEEVNTLIDEAMASSGATSMQDMGKVMGLLKPTMQGRADMGVVSKLIKAKLV